ncbi:MAG TPA: cupredoxin domain-containing protein [Ferrovibrio sp.]|uniref:cupredoxin domain-containing protein n=1 Tax=Ferrovibrio sp. TaxID=1917215 RepID=UPI002ED45696
MFQSTRVSQVAFLAALLLTGIVAIAGAGPARAGETPVFTLTIKDHKFDPATLQVPAGKRFELVVKNADATPEEFESKSLRREKIIKGGDQATIKLGPLKPGTYDFFGEFHEDTAKGNIVAK